MPATPVLQVRGLHKTFTLHLRPRWLGLLLDPLAGLLFAWETRRRFGAMARYLRAQRPVNAGGTNAQ